MLLEASNHEMENKNTTKNKKLVVKYLIKIIISCFLFYWILKDANFKEIVSAIRTAKWYILLLAFSLHFVGIYVSAVRWRLLLKTKKLIPEYFIW